MPAAWPSSLPSFLLGSDTESMPDNVLRTDMEFGPAKVRRRTTSTARPLEGTLLLTPAQRSTFDTFYLTTLVYGTLPFTMAHHHIAGTLLVRFREPPEYRTVRSTTETLSEVAVTLEVLP